MNKEELIKFFEWLKNKYFIGAYYQDEDENGDLETYYDSFDYYGDTPDSIVQKYLQETKK